MIEHSGTVSLLKDGLMGRRKSMGLLASHSNRKVNKGKKVLINLMYKLGVRATDIGNLVGISRATVYRYINK